MLFEVIYRKRANGIEKKIIFPRFAKQKPNQLIGYALPTKGFIHKSVRYGMDVRQNLWKIDFSENFVSL